MVNKHNKVIAKAHFKKDLFPLTKTRFNIPQKRKERKIARTEKAALLFPRPVGKLKPVVQCSSKRYNMRQKLGRGFTLDELKAVGLTPVFARSVGIAVDLRRTNHSEESLQRNVERLNEYKSKLVLFPRKEGKPKKGQINDSDAATLEKVQQLSVKALFPIKKSQPTPEFVEINEEDKRRSAFKRLKRGKRSVRELGAEVRKANAAEKEALTGKKKK